MFLANGSKDYTFPFVVIRVELDVEELYVRQTLVSLGCARTPWVLERSWISGLRRGQSGTDRCPPQLGQVAGRLLNI